MNTNNNFSYLVPFCLGKKEIWKKFVVFVSLVQKKKLKSCNLIMTCALCLCWLLSITLFSAVSEDYGGMSIYVMENRRGMQPCAVVLSFSCCPDTVGWVRIVILGLDVFYCQNHSFIHQVKIMEKEKKPDKKMQQPIQWHFGFWV